MRDACLIYGEVYCQPNPSALLTVANQLSDRLCPIPTSSQPEEYCQSLSGVASGTHTDEHGQPSECAELRADERDASILQTVQVVDCHHKGWLSEIRHEGSVGN